MPGYGRKEAAPPAPWAVMSARATSRRWSLGDEPFSMGKHKQRHFGAGFRRWKAGNWAHFALCCILGVKCSYFRWLYGVRPRTAYGYDALHYRTALYNSKPWELGLPRWVGGRWGPRLDPFRSAACVASEPGVRLVRQIRSMARDPWRTFGGHSSDRPTCHLATNAK